MLNAADKQFKLMDDGLIFYQPDVSNPTPGAAVAKIKKGAAALVPAIEMLAGQDAGAADVLNTWLQRHIATVLEPLVQLTATEGQPEPVRGVCAQLYEAMGIVPRENLEALIAALTPEMRQVLRAKKVRLGPVLVFLPDLNKPAGVRLRGLLWALQHDKELPAGVPKDGIVSLRVEPDSVDPRFYQAIGYPVYGPRAIRIDMLDRVIGAVYDNTKEGKFQAQHKMAEWLGCSIEDLYAVLAAMGHHKIHDPAAQPEKSTEEKSETEKTEKPELATFRLKKGKAFEKQVVREKKPEKPPRREKPNHKKPAKKFEPKKPFVIESGPKPKAEDSPFAILQQLKVKKDAS